MGLEPLFCNLDTTRRKLNISTCPCAETNDWDRRRRSTSYGICQGRDGLIKPTRNHLNLGGYAGTLGNFVTLNPVGQGTLLGKKRARAKKQPANRDFAGFESTVS